MNNILRILLLASIGISAIGAAAQGTDEPYPQIDIQNVAPKTFVPRGIDTRQVTVIALLAGDSVAVAQKKAKGALTSGDKDSIVGQRKADQDRVKPQIEAQGAKVIATYQHALNGIKVQIAKNRVDTLRNIPGVVAVKPVGIYEPTNTVSVPFIGAPSVWSGNKGANRGQSVKIAIIDTGIDYTHANFGGPGTVAAWDAAFAASTAPANKKLFGEGAPKVKGGIDLVGDNYDANFSDAAHAAVPDANPLDCNGHGSHVAGTAAGFGVSADGTTFGGKYDAAAYKPHAFKIGPGVAPSADLYAVRVFGCEGSTNVVTDAINWAVANEMDVISMSLGSDWGTADNADSDAIRNATGAGIMVIAAAGNAGPTPYITSSPGSSNGAVSVAATDVHAGYPSAQLALSGIPNPIVVQNSNEGGFVNGTVYPVVVLRNPDGTVSLGCNEAEYADAAIGGKLVVTMRGSCARVLRAQYGFQHGAAAVALINNGPGYPSFEGDIVALSGNGIVTIPFFGVLSSDAASLSGPTNGPAPATAAATVSAGLIANPAFTLAASFSSGGPRYGDSVLKPNVTAPGVSVSSTGMGTGSGSVIESGTSMATPHIAGVAALVRKAKDAWSFDDQRAAIVQTASPTTMRDYSPRLEGSGMVQALAAVNTQAVVRTTDDSLSFGFADLLQDFHGSRTVGIRNYGKSAITFNVSVTQVITGAGVTVNVPATITLNGKSGDSSDNGDKYDDEDAISKDDATLTVTLNVPAGAIGGTHAANGACCVFREIGGYIKLTPASSNMNNGVALTVPYYLVPRSRSNLTAVAAGPFGPSSPSTGLNLANSGAALVATPSFYALGLTTAAPQAIPYADTRAVGVRAIAGANPTLVFAVNTFDRFSNAAPNEWDIFIDTEAGAQYVLVGANGAFFTSAPIAQNRLVAALINLDTGAVTALRLADVATDNSTVLLPVSAANLGLTTAHPRFTYREQHFSGTTGAGAAMPGSAKFNAFSPAINVTYTSGPIAPNGSATGTVVVNAAEWPSSPALGLMVVSPDNVSGARQAQLLPVGP